MIKGKKDINNILLGQKEYNFLYNKNIIETKNDSIKIQIEKLSKLISKVEINTKNSNLDLNNLFMNIYEILSPSYKSYLEEKYLNEMPNNLYNLMQKYREVKITKYFYDNYKNKNIKLFKKINNNKTIYNRDNNNNFKNENINEKNKNIFKLKKLTKRININKINNKKINFENIKKKYFFRINKVKSKNKEEIKKRDESLNKMIIEEDQNKIKKKKNLFKCVSEVKKKENIFIAKKNNIKTNYRSK